MKPRRRPRPAVRRVSRPAAGEGGDPEWHYLEARRLMEAGKIRAAMEQAGFGVRLSLDRPEGYALLGELNLLDGDLVEARRSFEAAASRAQGDQLVLALGGAVQVAVLEGDLPRARELFERALREDSTDPTNLRPAFAEVLLALGDLPAARREMLRCPDESADTLLVRAVIHWRLAEFADAVVSARRAFLENVYLGARLSGDTSGDFGIVHGVEEATPEHAEALLDRLAPIIAGCGSTTAEFLDAVAKSTEAVRERSELVRIAKALQSEPRAAERVRLKGAVDALRDPPRIDGTTEAVLAEMRRDQPGLFGSASFDV